MRNLYEKVDPIQARFRFRQRPSTAEIMGKPLVVFLGNHSSGKSTFINYVLKRANPDFRDVQKTGVAPLDDGSRFLVVFPFVFIFHLACRDTPCHGHHRRQHIGRTSQALRSSHNR